MKNLKLLKPTFDQLATDGRLGHPNGKPAKAYIRVSTEEQAQEGATGLLRQIESIHHAAKRDGYYVAWDDIFADDHSGFEFEDRPALTKLLSLCKSGNVPAVIIEHLDRLSRNAKWHQGYLLEELEASKTQTVFWKAFGSELERAVFGAISDQGMKDSIERMRQGFVKKAESGRVPARKACFGYKIVDEFGNEGERAKKFSYYAINPEQADLVRYVFSEYAFNDKTLRGLARELNTLYPQRRWRETSIKWMIEQLTYKGSFIYNHTHQYRERRMMDDGTLKMVKVTEIRPQEEWIIVPVPAIVDDHTWQLANNMLKRNAVMSRRNAKNDYLLSGLLRCTCGYTFVGRSRNDKYKHLTYYRCNGQIRWGKKDDISETRCPQKAIRTDVLEAIVWNAVLSLFFEPERVTASLDRLLSTEQQQAAVSQVEYIQSLIAKKERERDKLYDAYMAEAFNAKEYAARKQSLENEVLGLKQEHLQAQSQIVSTEDIETRKAYFLALCNQSKGRLEQMGFEDKRKLLKLLVNEIVVDVNAKTFRVEGIIGDVFDFSSVYRTQHKLKVTMLGSFIGDLEILV